MSNVYEFDPCSIDGSDKEEFSIDTWKPTVKERVVPKSEWRQKQNDGNFNQQPGLDELHKIQVYLKKKYPDHQIMDAFGISAETLVAIKRNCYCPVEGISLDNLSKIYRKFNLLEKRFNKLFEALKMVADSNVFGSDTVKKFVFKTLIGMRVKKPEEKAKTTKSKKKKDEK